MKKTHLGSLLLAFAFLFFSPSEGFAVNELCAGTAANCCVAPQIITDGGGCPGSQVWIGDVFTGSCQTPIVCGSGRFLCYDNSCYTPVADACTSSSVDTGANMPCCADGQVAVRAGAGWICSDVDDSSVPKDDIDNSGTLPFDWAYTEIAQMTGPALLGRSAASLGDLAAISSTADGQVLRRSAGVLSFGALDLADTDAVTGTLAIGRLPTGAITNGNTTQMANNDVVFDFVMGQGFLTSTPDFEAIYGADANKIITGGSNFATAITGTTDFDTTGAFSINSSAGVINIGSDAVNGAINIGTATSGGREVTIGNTTGSSSVHLRGGTGPGGDITLIAPSISLSTTNNVSLNDIRINGESIYSSTASMSIGSGVGATSLGDGLGTVIVNSSDWDISATGVMTGISFDANGSGNSISNIESADILDNTITANDIGVGAVGTSEIADGSVSLTDVNFTVGSGDLTAISAADASITVTGGTGPTPSISRAALTGDVTAAAGSNTTAIAAGVVGTNEIADLSIAAIDIANAGIVASKIATGNITGPLIADNTITQVKMQTDSVGSAQISTAAVGTSEISDGSIAAIDVAADAIGASEIAASAVGTSEIADGSIAAADIANATITAAKLSFTAGDITGVTAGSGLTGGGTSGNVTLSVGTGTITATHLATDSVTNSEIGAGAVGTSELANNAVQAGDFDTGAVQARITGGPCSATQAMKNVAATGAMTCGTTTSDSRIKKDQQPLVKYGLETILALNPKTYDYYESHFENGKVILDKLYKREVGFIAQEVYKVIPEAVDKPENENEKLWELDYVKIIPVMVNAFKEIKTEIDRQASLIATQQAEIDKLKKDLIEIKRAFQAL